MATITPGGSLTNVLEAEWAPTFKLQCNEEARIFPTFDTPDGVSKIGNLLHISKISRITPTAVALATNDGKSLTYTANTENDFTVSPSFAYGAVEITQMAEQRLLRMPNYKAGLRKQIVAGLVAKKDADAGLLATSVSTTKGGIAQNFDKTFLLDGIGTLVENARDMYSPGQGKWAFLHIHPRQLKNILAINEITNAQIRGDAEKPIRTGWVWEAYGLALSESGNVYVTGGVAHNLLHIKESHVYGLNADFGFLPEQKFELVTRVIAFGEYGMAEQWDEYAVDMQTAG